MYETIHFDLDGTIGTLTLDVPGKLNAHTKQMRQELLPADLTRRAFRLAGVSLRSR